MITVVVGKEIEKIKGDFESVINGMNMVGKIPYDVYSELFDVGVDCIQKAYELGKSELEKENAELKGIKDVATLIRANNDTIITLMQLNNKLVSKSQQLTKAKEVINDLVHLGEFNEHTDEEYFNYQVHEALKNAEQFLSEVEK